MIWNMVYKQTERVTEKVKTDKKKKTLINIQKN